jgi:hypothetical protein
MNHFLRAASLATAAVIFATGTWLVAQGQPAASEAERLTRLETGVERAEAIRAIKRLQQTYTHYLDVGLWSELDTLVTVGVVADFPAPGQRSGESLNRDALRQFWMKEANRTDAGLAHGQLNAHLLLQPIINLGPDGRTAKGTWHQLAMLGALGQSATWVGGIYENEYVLENGVWKISRIHFSEQYRGAYEDPGQKAPPRWEIPYHFTAEHVGLTIPPAALVPSGAPSKESAATRLTNVTARLQKLEDEAAVQNLHNMYGYYVDRKMWDDVADLFAASGTFDAGQKNTYTGTAQIRKGLETLYGAPKLQYGELWDRLQLTTVVSVAPDGRTANIRATELSMLGLINSHQRWELGTYENEFVKENGVWKLKALHFYPRMITAYEKGWGKEVSPGGARDAIYPTFSFPAFHYPNPVTNKAVKYPAGVIKAPTVSTATRRPAARPIAELELMLARAIGFDAAENLMSAYGYYLDESAWDDVAAICASNCEFELSSVGIYIGRERARQALKLRYPTNGRSPNSYTIHQLTQPVITVSADGLKARTRMRLFQSGGAANGSAGSWIGGTYENQAFFDNGEWKFGVKDLQHHFNANYRNGWAKIAPRAARGAALPAGREGAAAALREGGPPAPRAGAPQSATASGGPPPAGRAAGPAPAASAPGAARGGIASFPPDRPERSRQYPFPEILEPAFHYKNPVSGRMPGELLP